MENEDKDILLELMSTVDEYCKKETINDADINQFILNIENKVSSSKTQYFKKVV